MQKHRPTIHGKAIQCLLQPKGVVERFLNEGLDHRLTPWVKHLPVKAPAEAADAGRCAMTPDQIRKWTAAGAMEEQSRHVRGG